MTNNHRSRFWGKAALTATGLFFLANLLVALWRGNAEKDLRDLQLSISQGGELQQRLARLSEEVDRRYEVEVRNFRRLNAISHWARDRQDFPVATGDHIVSVVAQCPAWDFGDAGDSETEENRIRVLFYVPPGPHRLKYSFRDLWEKKDFQDFDWGQRHPSAHGPSANAQWERNTITVDLPTGAVHEIEFLVEQDGEETLLRVSITNHHQRTFSLRPSNVVGHRGENRFHMTFPNQHLGPSDEMNPSASVWHRSETVLNELLYHGMRMASRLEDEQRYEEVYSRKHKRMRLGPRQGALLLRCWIDSDVRVSAFALSAAVNRRKFLQQYMMDSKYTAHGPVPNVDELFLPHDGSGNLYYRIPPKLD